MASVGNVKEVAVKHLIADPALGRGFSVSARPADAAPALESSASLATNAEALALIQRPRLVEDPKLPIER
jgi:hypothetical protein